MPASGPLVLHRRAGFWAFMAECRVARGRLAAARRCYSRAAELERRTFETLPLERPRSRGIIGRSTYWLLVKAGLAQEAAAWKARMAADPSIPAFALREMEDR
ncbi:MAG TPA: hypothetical protein VH208_01070 [Myxococcaceae bacterium]|nr:hypothetical protein [Myxococcaceae bacterium]